MKNKNKISSYKYMEFKNKPNEITLLSKMQKKMITILKKRQAKIQGQIDYIKKHGAERIKLMVTKRQNTMATNHYNKNPLPQYIEDDTRPVQLTHEERTINRANNKYKSHREPNQKHFKKFTESALNNTFRNVTIINDEFSIVSLMYEGME